MPNRHTFPNPFPEKHCAVLAFAYAAGMDESHAVNLANQMKARRGPTGRPYLTACGAAYNMQATTVFQEWCMASGLRVVSELWRPHCTVATFARRYPEGRWIVCSRTHAVACLDGVLHGFWLDGARVVFARRVEQVDAGAASVV